MGAFVYILQCADGHYYVGTTRGALEHRITEHNAGTLGGYTKSCRPVRLVYHQEFEQITDAVAVERKLKGWSRAKKQSLIKGDFTALKSCAKRRAKGQSSSFETPAGAGSSG